tara:strand:- start:355 stop:522 length:168 start_codon:yes stop_codon:yes gene_type:complete
MKRILILTFGTLIVLILTTLAMVLLGYTPQDTMMQICVGLPSASTYLYLNKKTKQ